MRQRLKLHPNSYALAARQVEVDIMHPRPGRLLLSYILKGELYGILMPSVAAPARADNLWHHTCFEAFVHASVGTAYYEFNFAPSTEWATYSFTSYRSGMSVATEASEPLIKTQSSHNRYILQATLDLDRLSTLPRPAGWRLGLAAVIEDADGEMSYWALAHPPGKPDFHRPDCFVHELSAAVVS
jgi:hypothetical protein